MIVAILGGVAACVAILGGTTRMVIIAYRIARTLERTVDAVAEVTHKLAEHMTGHDLRYAAQRDLELLAKTVDNLAADVQGLFSWRLGRHPSPPAQRENEEHGSYEAGGRTG